jgi:hypothetical protein
MKDPYSTYVDKPLSTLVRIYESHTISSHYSFVKPSEVHKPTFPELHDIILNSYKTNPYISD